MSYSFSITASSKDEAGQKVEQELAAVVVHQPIHCRDRQAAQDAAEAFINLLQEPDENEVINVSICGSLGCTTDRERLWSSSVSVSAYITAKS